MKRLLIVDFHALLHRCRNAMLRTGREFTTADGTTTTGVFSFLNTLTSCVDQEKPTHVVVCFDAGGNARKEESDDYKATRGPVSSNFQNEARILMNEMLPSLGIECIGARGFEADDCIATICQRASYEFDEIIVWTCDQDLLQLVTSKVSVKLFNSAKKQTMMDVDAVIEKWGCYPDAIALVKAISGDSSDNIKGVKGVGTKTALKICEEMKWEWLSILKHKKLKDHVDQLNKNLSLVILRQVPEVAVKNPDLWELGLRAEPADLHRYLEKYEMAQLLKRKDKLAKTYNFE